VIVASISLSPNAGASWMSIQDRFGVAWSPTRKPAGACWPV